MTAKEIKKGAVQHVKEKAWVVILLGLVEGVPAIVNKFEDQKKYITEETFNEFKRTHAREDSLNAKYLDKMIDLLTPQKK